MQFRKTCVSDIDRIMDILADGRRSLAAIGIDQWQGGYPHRDAIEGDVERGDSYVAVDDGGIVMATAMVGFAGERDYDRIEGGTWLTGCASGDLCYGVVHRVAVSDACRGCGMASLLLDNAERLTHEQGCASVRIDTHPGNAPMRRLLEKRGYAQCGTIYIAHAEEATPDRIAYEKLV
ncbi:MAG: GNAT family N-acetyltransferase [Gordonibacter sp.]|uniref:GNAT family N-acetyltransferase n=1 Tax=Gordonibacter sp. TaxID=1968902 RepID=UPI002FC91506